ncbi:MAG: hypothetical protein M1817_003693 [Caeruleum heppii]|nr:MAG: hypothetical protein M1817_003693 [Caeruleum heppii]
MPINWKSTQTYQRLLAAIYAASPQNHNYQHIATMFGEGATYDAIEGRFRIIKREAAVLKAEVESGERGPAPPRGSTTTTPKKPRPGNGPSTPSSTGRNGTQGVLSGRVTKGTITGSGASTPTKTPRAKGSNKTPIKREPGHSSNLANASSSFATTISGTSFSHNNSSESSVQDDDILVDWDGMGIFSGTGNASHESVDAHGLSTGSSSDYAQGHYDLGSFDSANGGHGNLTYANGNGNGHGPADGFCIEDGDDDGYDDDEDGEGEIVI